MNTDESPPRRLNRTEAKQQTRERLLAAATVVVARRGFAGASVDEIAATAGYTVGALYSQFGSKDKLIVEAMHVQVAKRVAEARSIMGAGPADSGSRDALGRLLVAAAAGTDPDDEGVTQLFWAELWLHAPRNPELAELLAQEARAVDETIAHSIRSRRTAAGTGAHPAAFSDDTGELSDQDMATVVSSLYRGLVQRRRLDPAAVPSELPGQAMQLLIAGRHATRPTETDGASS